MELPKARLKSLEKEREAMALGVVINSDTLDSGPWWPTGQSSRSSVSMLVLVCVL